VKLICAPWKGAYNENEEAESRLRREPTPSDKGKAVFNGAHLREWFSRNGRDEASLFVGCQARAALTGGGRDVTILPDAHTVRHRTGGLALAGFFMPLPVGGGII
jgi:hypothetical protein